MQRGRCVCVPDESIQPNEFEILQPRAVRQICQDLAQSLVVVRLGFFEQSLGCITLLCAKLRAVDITKTG
ncbi:Uncharacterised protein [Vibrio cholerae]|nr:Uncharacterised protein [Vibrio cholerae]